MGPNQLLQHGAWSARNLSGKHCEDDGDDNYQDDDDNYDVDDDAQRDDDVDTHRMICYHIRTRIDLLFIPKVSRSWGRYKFKILKTAHRAILMEFWFVWVGVRVHFFNSAEQHTFVTPGSYFQHQDHIWPLSGSVFERASNMALRSLICCTKCQLKYFNLSKWKQISEWLCIF